MLQEVFAAAFNAMMGDDRPINVRPWLYRIARNRSLNHLRRAQAIGVDSMDVHLVRARHHDRRQGAQARGVPPAHGGRPGAARDPAHGAAPARDRRPLLRADRRGDGDDGPVDQVAARARARVARRGGRGAPAHLRRGPRGARRGRRGPEAHDRAGPPPPARLRPLRRVPQVAARDQQGARLDAARSAPLLLLKKLLLAQPRHDGAAPAAARPPPRAPARPARGRRRRACRRA